MGTKLFRLNIYIYNFTDLLKCVIFAEDTNVVCSSKNLNEI